MRSTARERDHAVVWDVARPARPSRVAGVSMAGFRDRGMSVVGHRVVPHPAVTLAVEFGVGPLIVNDAAGRQQRGSLVAGLGFGARGVWVRGENFEAVQVRLSPVVARAILGVSPADLDGAAVALDDLWGREAARIGEQLGEVSSWEDRFALTDALLARRRETGASVDPEVAWVWDRIVVGRGLVRVDQLAAEVGWSREVRHTPSMRTVPHCDAHPSRVASRPRRSPRSPSAPHILIHLVRAPERTSSPYRARNSLYPGSTVDQALPHSRDQVVSTGVAVADHAVGDVREAHAELVVAEGELSARPVVAEAALPQHRPEGGVE